MINNIEIEKEVKWLADSGAATHVTNTVKIYVQQNQRLKYNCGRNSKMNKSNSTRQRDYKSHKSTDKTEGRATSSGINIMSIPTLLENNFRN